MNKKPIVLTVLATALFAACGSNSTSVQEANEDLTCFVDPKIGTGGTAMCSMGPMFPTDLYNWDQAASRNCGIGYQDIMYLTLQ